MRSVALSLVVAAGAIAAGACRGGGAGGDAGSVTDGGPGEGGAGVPSAHRATSGAPSSETAAPRAGMVWIPPGSLVAGTPPDRTPRVADEEMAGVLVEMAGFYVDLLPWPNEPNAIPTTNVTRDEAEQLCQTKGKRLCTELEWERACKGPDNTTYEYGGAYQKDVCGTGIAPEQAARRPTGEHAPCKSGFGVSELHGGVFEWTASTWGRGGGASASLGVLRGGNSPAGEIVGRCANSIARAPTKKAAIMGLRCCAGTKNSAEVKLDLESSPGLAIARASDPTPWLPALATAAAAPSATIDPHSVHTWTWTPVANEDLVVAVGCSSLPKACGLVIGRDADGGPAILTSVLAGRDRPELARVGDARHLRIRSLDAQGVFGRDITYLFGRIEIGDPKRH